jgi:hypothetical protein
MLPDFWMVKRKAEKEMAMPAWASKRAKGNKVLSQNKSASDTEVSNKPEDIAFACKPLRPGIPENEKELARLRTNVRNMECEGLLEVPWHHEEPEWLQEIWKKDMSVYPSTIGANPNCWKENMIAEVFGICREGLGLPHKVVGFNHALQYFGSKDDALRDNLKFLTRLVNPMKPAKVNHKLATIVLKFPFLDKKVSWARVLEDIMA